MKAEKQEPGKKELTDYTKVPTAGVHPIK